MTCYSVQPIDQIFVKGHEFYLLLEIWEETLIKIDLKT